jgi:hypothetical protein
MEADDGSVLLAGLIADGRFANIPSGSRTLGDLCGTMFSNHMSGRRARWNRRRMTCSTLFFTGC